jgi:hypothetical protein
MVRRRSLIMAAAIVSLTVGALAVPTAAQLPPRIAFVNGIPGTTAEVCIGNNEVKSRLRYGAWFQRIVQPGNRIIRFRRATAGNCNGALLGREDLVLANDDDLTLVATRFSDKVVNFDNTPLPAVPATTWWRSIRHAADVGPVVFATETDSIVPSVLPDTFAKEDENTTTGGSWTSFWIAATRLDQSKAMVQGHFMVVEGRRGEVILVGTKASNARLVFINRANPA